MRTKLYTILLLQYDSKIRKYFKYNIMVLFSVNLSVFTKLTNVFDVRVYYISY